MHKNTTKMKRAQNMRHLLLACLLLAASQNQNFIFIMAQAIEPDNVQLGTAPVRAQTITHSVSPSWEENGAMDPKDEKSCCRRNIPKAPSGPNPVGNRLPPSLP